MTLTQMTPGKEKEDSPGKKKKIPRERKRGFPGKEKEDSLGAKPQRILFFLS